MEDINNTNSILLEKNLNQIGFSKEEISLLMKKNILNNNNNSHKINKKFIYEIDENDLLLRLKSSDKYKKYPKSTIKYMIQEYKKQSSSIVLCNSLFEFINNNIDEFDQEVWNNDSYYISLIEKDSIDLLNFSKVNNNDNLREIIEIRYENEEKYNQKQDYRNFISGIASSLISRTSVAPLDRLKMLYQNNYIGNTTPNIFIGLKNIYLNEGIRGYFKGNGVNILKGAPENGIKFYSFEMIKWKIQLIYGDNLTSTMLFFSGAMSGLLATLVTFPLEVIKLRIGASQGEFLCVFDIIKNIKLEKGGYLNFYSGIEASLCIVIPNAGLTLLLYESLKRIASGSKALNNSLYLSAGVIGCIGSFSALISSSILFPMMTVQSRMIMYNIRKNMYSNSSLSNNDKLIDQIKFFYIIKKTYQIDGIKGFYKGFLPNSLKLMFGNGIGFAVYETTRKVLGVNKS